MRNFLRKVLLKLLLWTESKPVPTTEKGVSFLYKKIYVPPFVVIIVNAIVLLVLLLPYTTVSWYGIIGLMLLIIIFCVLTVIYVRLDFPQLTKDNEAILLLGFLILTYSIMLYLVRLTTGLSPFILPVPAIAMLTSLLLHPRLSLILTILFSIISSYVYDFSMAIFLLLFLGGIVATISVIGAIRRQDIIRAGIKVTVMNILVVIMNRLLSQAISSRIEEDIIWAAGNGLISVIIVLGTLPYWEIAFSRVTNIKLIELANFDQPLLRRLMTEAQGTYHHSLIVASLAEQAAEAVGANSLMTRVGAYYHDIGKLIKPEYFIENQLAIPNPHEVLEPSMSGLIIISHVKEGIKLANIYHIDRPIIDLIEQHHGSSLLQIFYKQALKEVNNIPHEDFRYPGPKPKTKEAAILMIADACEAASRAMEELSPARINEVVKKIVNNKFIDGQFDEAPMTLADLHKVTNSIAMNLLSIYHTRVEYKKEQ